MSCWFSWHFNGRLFSSTLFMRTEKKAEKKKPNQRNETTNTEVVIELEHFSKFQNPINIRNIYVDFLILSESFSIFQFIQFFFTPLSPSLWLSRCFYVCFFFHFVAFSGSFILFFSIRILNTYMFEYKRRTGPVVAEVPLQFPNVWMNVTIRFKLLIGTINNLDAVNKYNAQKRKETDSSTSEPESTLHTIWLNNERTIFFTFPCVAFNWFVTISY